MTELTIDSTAAEEASLYAHTIIDFFAKGLSTNMCLSQVPVSLYVEAKQHIERIEDMDEAIYNNGINPTTVDSSIVQFQQTPLARAIIRKSGNNCLNCGIAAPSLNVKGLVSDSLLDASKFIRDVQNLFNLKINKALPSFAYLLAFLCIPDLMKLLSIILSSVIDILATVFVGTFSLTGFIMAIINKVISALFGFINIMLNFSLSPVLCIIDALDQVIKAIPTPDNVSTLVTGKQKEGTYDQYKKEMSAKLAASKNVANEELSEQFSAITETVKSSVDDINSNIEKLLGVKTHFECEAKRNGSSISDSVERLSTLLAIANLIKSIISKKTKKTATNTIASSTATVNPLDEQLTNSEIVEALSDAIGQQVDIVTDGVNDIGVYIGADKPISDNLDLFSCNLGDFIDSSNMDKIVEEAILFAEDNLKGNGNNPSYNAPATININDIDRTTGMFIRLQNSPNDNIITTVKDIFDFMGKINPYDETDDGTQNFNAVKVDQVPEIDNPYYDNSLTINENLATNIKSTGKIKGNISSTLNVNKVQLHSSLEELGIKLSQLSSR